MSTKLNQGIVHWSIYRGVQTANFQGMVSVLTFGLFITCCGVITLEEFQLGADGEGP